MQDFCFTCKARFFRDEEDLYEGYPVCSHCYPYVQLCEICNKPHKAKKIVKNEFTICPSCCGNVVFPNINLLRRFLTFRRDNFTCRYCGRSPLKDATVELQIDHIVPKAKGGEDAYKNYVTACSECNHGKIDFLLSEYQQHIVRNRPSFGGDSNSNDQVAISQGDASDLAHGSLLAKTLLLTKQGKTGASKEDC